ncbi:MAG TPA: DUF1559 domain-containing protein [Gemmataceae bacterium]|nr:DUF1559 domain-containing protein [Gemmataceae bacterium]
MLRGMPRRRPAAFTLIEVLVVIAIFVILIGLLLPAIQKVRESAARTQCTNNLRNLGLGLLYYQFNNKVFPPGGTTASPQHGWGTYILPYIERDDVYRLYQWSLDWYHPANNPAVSTEVKTFFCPSTPSNRSASGLINGVPWKAATSDYAPTREIDPWLVELLVRQQAAGVNRPVHTGRAPTGGVMPLDGKMGLDDITDGPSQTILLAEVAGRPQLFRRGTMGMGVGTAPNGPWASALTSLVISGSTPDGLNQPGECALNCTNNDEIYSFHAGGANLLFADGSVRFVGERVHIRVVAALVTPRGGELVSGHEF